MKKSFLHLAVLFAVFSFTGNMAFSGRAFAGVEEKRALTSLKDQAVPSTEKRLKELTGAEIKYDVDWASFENDLKAMNDVAYHGFQEVEVAMRYVGRDQIGKDGIQKGVKTIKFKNIEDPAQKKISLADGILSVEAAWGKQGGQFSNNQVADVLNKNL